MPPILIPTPNLPKPLDLPRMTLKVPTARVPSYKPIVIPPSDLERPAETQPAKEEEEKEETKTEQPAPPKLKIPVINIDLPVPTVEVVAVASYAAVSAVVVTTFAEPVSKSIKKKIQKFLQGKVNKWKENRKKKKEKASSTESKEKEVSSKKNK